MNLMLMLSAALCVYSSFKFKVHIMNVERNMVLNTVRTISLIATVTLVASLVFIMFINENKCVGLVFIFILIIDALRAIKLSLYTKDKHKVEVKDYLVSLKWLTFSTLGLIIFGSFFYNLIRLWRLKELEGMSVQSSRWQTIENTQFQYAQWMDYLMLFFEKNGMIPRLVSIV